MKNKITINDHTFDLSTVDMVFPMIATVTAENLILSFKISFKNYSATITKSYAFYECKTAIDNKELTSPENARKLASGLLKYTDVYEYNVFKEEYDKLIAAL